MGAGYSFRPRAWALIAAGAACAAGIALGNWQAGRAAEKQALHGELARALSAPAIEVPSTPVGPSALVHKKVAARGRFVDEHTIYLDNKLRRGRPGYEVVTPLRLDGMHVLVNRGWVAAGATRERLPAVAVPRGEVRVEGIALPRLPRVLQPGPSAKGKVRLNVDLAAYENETGLRLHPFVIEQHSATADGLLREWPRADAGIEKHQSYALQWYALSALAVVLFLVFSFRRVGTP